MLSLQRYSTDLVDMLGTPLSLQRSQLRYGTQIGVQATAAGRRRKGVSRGKARSTSGRPKASSLANRLYSCKTGLSTDNKINVICYTFAFNIATATASSLGLVSSIAVIIFTVNFVLLKCSHGQDKTLCRAVRTVGIQAITFLIILGSRAGTKL